MLRVVTLLHSRKTSVSSLHRRVNWEGALSTVLSPLKVVVANPSNSMEFLFATMGRPVFLTVCTVAVYFLL